MATVLECREPACSRSANTDATGFNHDEFARYGDPRELPQCPIHQVLDHLFSRRPWSQPNNSWSIFRRESNDVTEIGVDGNKRPSLLQCELPDDGVIRSTQPGIEHRNGIMSGSAHPEGMRRRHVFVEQQLHTPDSTVSSAASCEA